MAIPPFPSQDLAKLVLGYLIEEQLMTAYDEFLHQSPYLDAEKNEFDRIAMQPLRHLLGEYRAVKIYVESCKPIALRRRLFQCPNLLEVVKLLVQYVDVKRVQEDLCRDQVSADSQEPTSRTGCEACLSLKLESCVCNNRRRKVSSTSINNSESVEAGRTIATNTLSDLSGNQNLDNRHVEVTASHTNQSNTISQQELLPGGYPGAGAPNVDQNSIMPNLNLQPNPSITITQPPNVTGNATAMECSQNIAEFNTVLNQVYNKTNVMGGLRDNNSMMSTDTTNNNRIPNCQPESFQDFSTGVRGPGASSTHINVPDSSTTENLTVPLSHPDTEQTISNKRIVKKFQKRSCAFRVGNVKHDVTEITSEVIDVDDDTSPNPKLGEQKVTILSNVKVGNNEGLIKMSKNATSTPLLQFQTICLNGTPIFKPKSVEQRMIYTKDEIMAMPTLILVPASGPSNTAPTVCQPQTISAQSSNITTSTTSAPPTLTPLTVDVSNSTSATCNVSNAHKPEKTTAQDTTSQSGLVKTVESLRNASVPKDNTVPGSSSTSTPQGLPPMRKSSSTPRRTISHVRVLDFTTPRRILNEAISENPNEEAESDKPVEIMISKSPNVSFPRNSIILDNIGQSDTTVDADKINESESNGSVKKKIVESKKRDWDADLRALVAGSQQPLKQRIPSTSPKSKPKKKTIKKTTVEKENIKNKTIINTAEKTRKKSSVKNSDSVNNKLSKKKDKPESVARPEENVPSPTVSPIGIMQYAQEKPAFEPEKVKDKSNDEEHIVTPEVERLSLRNEIGGKLNISDILETPYKQALYEIQMETPRFLGPDIPDDPMSDIKITDIPTPRFLTSNTPFTPKPKQATPSSYSSRPTDYSSGGSYYKPDDQDYLRIVDDTICPVTSTHSKDNSKETVTESTAESDLKDNKPKRSNRSRPVRQCTKNVSYYNSPMTTKSMNSNKKDDVSSCSDSASANSSFENAVKEDVHAPRSERKHTTKSENRSKLSLSKKRSPLKKVTQKSFMKIKPRHTPTKDSSRKSNRKSSESSQVTLKGKPRMRTSCKVPGTSPHAAAAPTKRRRKSATPRKLHRTEFKSSDHDSPEAVSTEKPKSEIQNSSVSCVQDSDTEQLPLRWSDDGSQESRAQGETESNRKNEDEISKIKEYIDKTMNSSHKDNEMSQIKEYIENTMVSSYKENEGSLQNDLIKRGFDIETAKKIERDLLSTPVPENRTNLPLTVDEERSKRILERPAESESTLPKNVISEEEYLEEDFSVYDCKEGSANYLIVQHDGIARPAIPPEEDPKLKDKFSLEICIDDGDVVRLRASSYNILMDEDFQDLGETIKETEMAVSSISNIDRLYTPMKDHIRAQCYSIFDSTLTSIDTPLKADSPSRIQNTISVTIEDDPEEIPELREKTENRKRKRLRCSSASDESVTDNKRVKPDTHMILTKDLKNMDIEVLLAKLHGSTKN